MVLGMAAFLCPAGGIARVGAALAGGFPAAAGDPFRLVRRVDPVEDYLARESQDGPATPRRIGGEPAMGAESGGAKRSPLLAGILSAAVPGAGQFYNGNRFGYMFLGIETAGWLAYASMRSTGNDKERQYRRFADAHWSFDRYRDKNSGPCTLDGHSDGGVLDSTLVFLYYTRRDDYYEDIGKLSVYSCGWDTPQNRNVYRDMRNDSNFFLRNARYATTIVFLNHLVSALQAVREAAGHNARLPGGAELDLRWSPRPWNPSASLVVSRHF